MSVDINYLGVFLAAIATMIVGSVWYAQGVFGRRWAKLARVKMDGKPSFANMAPLLIAMFIASLISAYILAHFMFAMHYFYADSWLAAGLSTAFLAWLGFLAMRVWTHDLFEKRPLQLTMITVGSELVTFLAMGAVLGWLHP